MDPKLDSPLLAPADAHTPMPRGFARAQESLRRVIDNTATENLSGPGGTAARLPRIGDLFLGFNIVAKLGEGGFGTVFLGEEVQLAGRKVALKFTNRPNREPERLAEMQHTNIVPVYSVHTMPPIQVLCMPYLGRQTLQGVVEAVAKTRGHSHTLPRTGAALLSENKAGPSGPKAGKSSKAKSRLRAKMKARAAALAPAADAAAGAAPDRERLEGLSFKESVLWLFTRLADALAHAHGRGILHLDLKPSNVLMTDGGVPMILDFGLAYDTRTGQYDQAGGTPRYMAPEQLIGYAHPGHIEPDARMDLYALGLMFFELLTGGHPFEATSKPGVSIHRMLHARQGQPPRVRSLNPDVDPAVDAIVAKLLQPDPDRRYASAADLLTDLTLHQENRPVRFAGNPSLWERVRKARRRHPILAVCMVAGLFALTTTGAVATAAHQARQRSEAEAKIQAEQLHRTLVALRTEFSTMDRGEDRRAALVRGEALLALYEADGNADWRLQPAVTRLKPDEQAKVQCDLTELAALMAHACRINALHERGEKEKGEAESAASYARALGYNALAAKLNAGRPALAGLAAQRADLLRLAKLPADPAAEAAEPTDPLDFYLAGLSGMASGEYDRAVKALLALVEKHPEHAAGQLGLGWVYFYKASFVDAAERFQLAKALAPADPRAPFNRGLLLRLRGKQAAALAEFDAAVARDPNFAVTYYYRAQTLRQLGRPAEAVADCTRAIEAGQMEYAALILRAELHEAAGSAADARADRDRVAAREPKTESEFYARGRSRLAADPVGALADYDRALALNRRYFSAWLARAAVLNDRLGEPEKALEAFDEVLNLNPQSAHAMAQQAVILGRMGKADLARAAVTRLAPWNEEARTWFDCARAMALAGDPQASLDHLRHAFRAGFADFQAVIASPDLAPYLKTQGFADVVAAAKTLHGK